ncbi:MAG: hypothetical protein NTV58_14545 [Deltaproteobacteria bacterium]|nr:hypothetical protein [Deltaproteobacteria bacterium]
MGSIESRIRKVESAIGQESREAGARDLVSFGREVGLIGPNEDTAQMVEDFIRTGFSVKSLLRDIDGLTLGPPSLRAQ